VCGGGAGGGGEVMYICLLYSIFLFLTFRLRFLVAITIRLGFAAVVNLHSLSAIANLGMISQFQIGLGFAVVANLHSLLQ